MRQNSQRPPTTFPLSPSFTLALTLTLLLLCISPAQATVPQRPHVLMILADDLGWNDVGFRDPDMATPNIDRLAREGVILNSAYMQQVCTPSRASLLSGFYPFRLGLQNSVLTALANGSMPLNYRLFPQDLKELGYSTQYVGKWHLGFCKPEMTPTYRGFDYFYGKYTGKSDYYTHISKWNGYDLQNNRDHGPGRNFSADTSANGTYSTELFTNKTVDIIQKHDAATPLFLFLSYQAVHGPLQVPKRYISKYCATVKDHHRKSHCAMTAAMDEGIGQVIAALEARGFSDNLITWFSTDNGGPVKLGSSNWPLRGSKITLWEGGTRAVCILHSKTHLPSAPYVWNGLMHAVDWYPTLMSAVGHGGGVNGTGMDGVDNWQKIVTNGNSARTGFVYNIDEVKDNAAIRSGPHKLVYRTGGKPDLWYNAPAGVTNNRKPPKRGGDYQLYNIETDPEELHNLSNDEDKVAIMKDLKQQLASYRTSMEPSQKTVKVPAGKPNKHGGLWVSGWC